MKSLILFIGIIFLFYNCTKKNETTVIIDIKNMKKDTAMFIPYSIEWTIEILKEEGEFITHQKTGYGLLMKKVK